MPATPADDLWIERKTKTGPGVLGSRDSQSIPGNFQTVKVDPRKVDLIMSVISRRNSATDATRLTSLALHCPARNRHGGQMLRTQFSL